MLCNAAVGRAETSVWRYMPGVKAGPTVHAIYNIHDVWQQSLACWLACHTSNQRNTPNYRQCCGRQVLFYIYNGQSAQQSQTVSTYAHHKPVLLLSQYI